MQYSLVWLTLLYSFSILPHVCTIVSPETHFISQLFESFRGPGAMNVSKFLSSFQMPDCMQRCMPKVDDMFRQLKLDGSDEKGIGQICGHLQTATTCSSIAGCTDLFSSAATKAFQFMCIDNVEQLPMIVGCVQKASETLQQECEVQCGTAANVLDTAARKPIEELFDSQKLCNSSICLLTCVKDRVNARCQLDKAGGLLDTVLSSINSGVDSGFEKLLPFIVPNACEKMNVQTMMKPLSNSVPLETLIKTRPLNLGTAILNNANRNSLDEPILDYSHAALLVNNQLRTLQWRMYDWQGFPVETPSFEELIALFEAQDQTRPSTTVAPRDALIIAPPCNEAPLRDATDMTPKKPRGVVNSPQNRADDSPTWRENNGGNSGVLDLEVPLDMNGAAVTGRTGVGMIACLLLVLELLD